jgi:nicotinamidase-related amidase
MQPAKIICVDFQKDFSAPDGICYRPRPCVDFIKDVLIPHLRQRGLKVAEIVSDYRLPRPGDEFECCVPGEPGFESEIPDDVKHPQVWVKCMNSPIWVRDNGGVAGKPAGLPYPDPAAFTEWLRTTVGAAKETGEIILMGLTLDCCVLCTAQELSFRGYRVKFLVEAVDTYSGTQEEKQALLKIPLANWGQPISWQQLKRMTTGLDSNIAAR